MEGVREGERDWVIWRWLEDAECWWVWGLWWCLARRRGCWLMGVGLGVEGVECGRGWWWGGCWRGAGGVFLGEGVGVGEGIGGVWGREGVDAGGGVGGGGEVKDGGGGLGRVGRSWGV